MSKKIYVGNLSYDTDDQGLKEIFSEFGTVEGVNIITDRDTGRSKGFGFVEMAKEEEAANAISGLNGKDINGRQLKVDEARERQERKQSRGGGGRRDNDRFGDRHNSRY